MNLLLRMLVTFMRSSIREKCRVDSTSSMRFVVWPWEAEWKVISHASLLTILDVARQDHMQRMGFLRLLLKNGWFLPVASVHVSFRRPILRFHRITVTTRISYWDDKNILIEHEVMREGRLMATSIVRGMIKKGRETVSPRSVVTELGGGTVDEAALARLSKLIELDTATTPPSAN
jgi:acyl-CoA thioesterase FadM